MRLFICIFFLSSSLIAQHLDRVEKVMATYPSNFTQVEDLAKRLSYDFKTDQERVKAAYIWIVNNIAYDYKLEFVKPKHVWIRYRTEQERLQKEQDALDNRLNAILKERKTLCYGFSNLFKRLCDLMFIKSVTINGYTKLSANLIGNKTPYKNHSWNAALINGNWLLFDLTWAAGYTNVETNAWLRERNDYYFATAPEQLISTHLPANSKWQLLPNPISLESFFNNPIFYPDYFKNRMLLDQNEDGLLKRYGNNVSITFSNLPTQQTLFYSINGSRDLTKVNQVTQTKNGKYVVTIRGLKKSATQLTLYNQLTPSLDFKLESK